VKIREIECMHVQTLLFDLRNTGYSRKCPCSDQEDICFATVKTKVEKLFFQIREDNFNMKSAATWDVMPCMLVAFYRRFIGTYCFRLQGRSISRGSKQASNKPDFSAAQEWTTAFTHDIHIS
jgi:hypothetical protein